MREIHTHTHTHTPVFLRIYQSAYFFVHLSLSLSLSHTHTHTHTQLYTCVHTYVRDQYNLVDRMLIMGGGRVCHHHSVSCLSAPGTVNYNENPDTLIISITVHDWTH